MCTPEDAVFWLALCSLADAAPLTIHIEDPYVIAVVLECDNDLKKATVRDNKALFPDIPKNCKVDLIRRTGVIDEAGVWSCGLDGCKQDDVHHAPISNAPGRINVVFTGDSGGTLALELTCSSGHRERVDVKEATTIFNDVPAEDCTIQFKGGVPARFRHITPGTWYCSLTGATAVCDIQG